MLLFQLLPIWMVVWVYRIHLFTLAAPDSGGAACAFTIDHLEYDLCPILRDVSVLEISIDEETPPTRTRDTYVLSLGAGLKRDGTLPAELQCPEGTRICLTVVNTRPSHPSEPSRILQVVPVAGDPGLKPRASLIERVKEGDLHAPLQVTLHGGEYMHHSQKAAFQFHCDNQIEEPSKPGFLWKWNGTHTFSWKTRHACPRALSTPPPPPQPPVNDPDPPEVPPKDPEADPGPVQDLVPRRFPILSIILWLFVPSLIILRIIYTRYPYHYTRTAASAIMCISPTKRPASFRPSASRLVRWAQDAELEESGDEEEVPLKQNPRGSFGPPGRYGST